jgi:hypothetical protein
MVATMEMLVDLGVPGRWTWQRWRWSRGGEGSTARACTLHRSVNLTSIVAVAVVSALEPSSMALEFIASHWRTSPPSVHHGCDDDVATQALIHDREREKRSVGRRSV